MICTNCVQKNVYELCGCRISNNITIDFDEVERYLLACPCFNLGALADFFST